MAPIDPELRRRQLARLRVAYDASPNLADGIGNSTARHSRVLLGRILVVLSGPPRAGAPESQPAGKVCADA